MNTPKSPSMPAAEEKLFANEPRHILLLEDDNLFVTLFRERIAREWPQCKVEHASGKSDYVSALNKGIHDIVVSDYNIPSFPGLAALEITRKQRPELPFLFLSGAIGDDIAVESLKFGATDYILKDRPARLVPAIRRALEGAMESQQRKLAVASLERSFRNYEALVNSVDGIVWQARKSDLRFIFVSEQAERLLGYRAQDWLDEPNFWQRHIHPEDREMAVKFCSGLTPELNHVNFEYRMVTADGRVVWLRDMVSVHAGKDQALLIQGIMVDITERKLAEEKVKEVQSKLEGSNRDLLHRNHEIQNFYHTLSHELKTPLTSAREFVSMVMDGVAGELNEAQKEYLGYAKESCDQLKVCINDLLDTTRLETGKLALEFKAGALAEIVHRVVLGMKSSAAEHNVTLTSTAQPELPDVLLDEHRITQVVVNLLNNAFKHTPAGGKIHVETFESQAQPGFLQVSVSDTGCGIAKQEQERIFERLYHVKTGDAANGQGIGLGLYLCRELLNLHGGGIWVESEQGQGSTFSFAIPKSQKLLQPNVLVIDDDRELLETVRTALAEEYSVRTATDGTEGLHELRQQLPDVILLDLSMPGLDGLEALKEVRKHWSSIPLIIHTAYTNGDLMKKAMEYSPFTLLAKPSSISQLRETVHRVLRSADTVVWTKSQWDKQKHISEQHPDTLAPLAESGKAS